MSFRNKVNWVNNYKIRLGFKKCKNCKLFCQWTYVLKKEFLQNMIFYGWSIHCFILLIILSLAVLSSLDSRKCPRLSIVQCIASNVSTTCNDIPVVLRPPFENCQHLKKLQACYSCNKKKTFVSQTRPRVVYSVVQRKIWNF